MRMSSGNIVLSCLHFCDYEFAGVFFFSLLVFFPNFSVLEVVVFFIEAILKHTLKGIC